MVLLCVVGRVGKLKRNSCRRASIVCEVPLDSSAGKVATSKCLLAFDMRTRVIEPVERSNTLTTVRRGKYLLSDDAPSRRKSDKRGHYHYGAS